jgi:Tfp pilus assembly PilM family ATPase
LVPPLIDLAEQIKKYLDYYQTHTSHEHLPPNGKKVEKVLLCGGGANLKGLVDFFSQELNLPVELGNPWINILPEDQKKVPQFPLRKALTFTSALGLALRGIKRND